MNYIKHLTAYFDRVVNDQSLNPTHISLYVAFFQFWNLNRFQNPISINRDDVMRISKICSKATYHKCIRDLHNNGYIIYEPSYNPFKGSIVHMLNLNEQLKPTTNRKKTNLKNEVVSEQVVNKQCTSIGTGTEQALVSSINIINNTNNTNISNLDKHKNETKNNQFKNDSCRPEQACTELSRSVEGPKKKLREKKGNNTGVIPSGVEGQIPPDWNNVLDFFKEKNATELDAQKFYNHFQSNGWLVGGKSKMKDWKAAARNWLLNGQKFSNNKVAPQPNHLQTTTHKNYGEPL